MNRDRLIIFAFIALLTIAMIALAYPIFGELEMLAASKEIGYITVSGVRPLQPWTSFAEVAAGVGGSSFPVRQEHAEGCRITAAVPGGGVAVGDLGSAFCQSLRVHDRHIAVYRRGWFTGRLTLTDLILVQQKGDLSE